MKVNLYKSIFQAYIHPSEVVECTFPEFVEFMTKNQSELDVKESGMLFNLCSFVANPEPPTAERFNPALTPWPRESLIRRCKQNIQEIYALMLDIDGTMTLDQAVAQWADYEFFLYSTHGNTRTKEKFRLVVPLAVPLTADDFDSRHSAMIAAFNVDGASFTMSQAFYLPSYSAVNRDIAFVHWNKTAQRYNALDLPAEELQRNHSDFVAPEQRTESALSILRTLQTGSNLHYVDALPLAVLCKGHGITGEEYAALVEQIAAYDSQLRGDVDLGQLYKQAYAAHMTRKRMLALMKRINCNTWRWGE
jgi:hypothetical protein